MSLAYRPCSQNDKTHSGVMDRRQPVCSVGNHTHGFQVCFGSRSYFRPSYLCLARVGVPESVLGSQLVYCPPGELHDLFVRQVAEFGPHLVSLFAKAQEVLLDDVVIGSPLLAGNQLSDEALVHGEMPGGGGWIGLIEEENLGLKSDPLRRGRGA